MEHNEDYDRNESPLANRMKPETLDEVCGQQHILGKGKLLRKMIEGDCLTNIILWGPPGTGKTSIANVIANVTDSNFISINATTSGKKEMEDVINEAKKYRYTNGKKTILFIDEIHRFSKAQQDYLLSYAEKGIITLIGATTENPHFEVNAPLLSRSTVFELKALNKEDIKSLIQRAIANRKKGIRNPNVTVEPEAVDFIAEICGGDCRMALNALELAVNTAEADSEGKVIINLKNAQECVQKRTVRYDKNGSNHYDVISAFIKSIRNSDVNAALYYLAMMIEAGEDPMFISRRMVIAANEDIGLADVQASVLATSTMTSVKQVGMPESIYALANCAMYLALAPKSNSAAVSIKAAIDCVRQVGIKTIPPYLQDAHYDSSLVKGIAEPYIYPHDLYSRVSPQEYLPEEIQGRIFYNPNEESLQGGEQAMPERLKEIQLLKALNAKQPNDE